jgi:ferredoxin
MNTRKLVVDAEKCTSAGMCMSVAPASFEAGEDFITAAINPPGDPEADVLWAIDQCPMRAIFFVDEAERRQT